MMNVILLENVVVSHLHRQPLREEVGNLVAEVRAATQIVNRPKCAPVAYLVNSAVEVMRVNVHKEVK
jgi:hypothetical protein